MASPSSPSSFSRAQNRRFILFCFPDMEVLAQELLQKFPEVFEKGEIEWGTFPDGTPNVLIKNVPSIHYRNVVFLANFRNVTLWVSQIAVLFAMPRYLARSFTVVLPFFPTGTMERVDTEGQVATAMTLSRILSCIPLSHTGPSKIVIFDIHALQIRFYFNDKVLPCLLSAMPLLKQKLRTLSESGENVAVAFPDEGALKRFKQFFKGDFPLVLCSKQREGDARLLRVTEGDPRGCHVVIVDDLVQSGGTLIACKEALLHGGAARVSAFITHAVFPNGSWKRFAEDKQWNKIFITNTIPETVKEIGTTPPFELLSIGEEITKFLRAFWTP